MLELRPCDLATARRFVGENHRHNKPPSGHKFSVACVQIEGGVERLVGIAMVGRPIARNLDDGMTLEITRNCTDGTKNACSILYGACCRAAAAMGYKRIVTYTLDSEPGTSLLASGFTAVGHTKPDNWDRPGRHREVTQTTLFGSEQKYDTGPKTRWEKKL